jgi:hypothetical protein
MLKLYNIERVFGITLSACLAFSILFVVEEQCAEHYVILTDA